MLCMAFSVILTGCTGYAHVGPGGPNGGTVFISPPAPNVVVFGGTFDRPSAVRAYSHRGFNSRAAARGRGGGGRGGPSRGGGSFRH